MTPSDLSQALELVSKYGLPEPIFAQYYETIKWFDDTLLPKLNNVLVTMSNVIEPTKIMEDLK